MTADSSLKSDALLDCLVIFARRFNRPVSHQALVAGLPVEPGAAGPELFSLDKSRGLFSRVAKRAGFASRLIETPIEAISPLVLPAILVLRNRGACIIESIDHEKGTAEIIVPEVPEGQQLVELSALREQYLGFAFLLKRKYQYKRRALQLIESKRGHWFWGTLRRSAGLYSSVLLASFMVNTFILATPMFTMNVYDRVVPNDAVETLWVLAIGVGIVFFFDAIMRFTRTYLLEIAGKKSDVIMSSILFEKALNLRMDHWPSSVGAFASHLREFESLRHFFTSATLTVIIDLPFAILFLAVIAYIGGPIALIPLFSMLSIILYSLLLMRPLRESIEQTYEATANKHALLVESLQTITTIKTLGSANKAQWDWEESTGEIADKSLRARLLSNSITTITHVLVQLTTIGVVIAGVYLIKEQAFSLGAMIATVILASRTVAPMGQLASILANHQQSRTAYNTLNELMKQPVEQPENPAFIHRPEIAGRIELRNLDFTYPNSERAALQHASLTINPGEHLAILGKLGSGKSTIAKLLLGLYRPSQGMLLIDDLDIQQLDPADLRRQIAYVPQEVALFNGSVRENILMKDPHLDNDGMLRAARLGGVDTFINSHPQRYELQVGEQGRSLSGGQRQCIGIARALLLDTPIVVLDEPTSNMDHSTEQVVKQRLFEHTRQKTLIMVTHKKGMLDLVERVIVVDNGRILLDGPKDQVIAQLQGANT